MSLKNELRKINQNVRVLKKSLTKFNPYCRPVGEMVIDLLSHDDFVSAVPKLRQSLIELLAEAKGQCLQLRGRTVILPIRKDKRLDRYPRNPYAGLKVVLHDATDIEPFCDLLTSVLPEIELRIPRDGIRLLFEIAIVKDLRTCIGGLNEEVYLPIA